MNPATRSPRERRLAADLQGMHDLAAAGSISFKATGETPEWYELLIDASGLATSDSGAIAARSVHRCTIYLHLDYPRRPPVITWQTPIFHPNILPPENNGGVCIGGWSAGESLADLIARVIRLVTYESFNTSDALNERAAQLLRDTGFSEGAPVESLIGQKAPT